MAPPRRPDAPDPSSPDPNPRGSAPDRDAPAPDRDAPAPDRDRDAPAPEGTGRTRRRYAPRLPPARRREQLIDAALRVIVEQGYAGVSIEAVARTAGVTRPVIYDHFPNLDALLRALHEREENYALTQLSEFVPAVPRDGDPAELIATGVRRFLDAVASRPDTWRIILLPLEGTPAIVREHVETNRAQILARLERFVEWALGRAGIETEIDVEICARAMLRLSEEAGRMVLTQPDRFTPERYERFAEVTMRLILGPR